MKRLLFFISMLVFVPFLRAMNASVATEYPAGMSITARGRVVYFSTGRTVRDGDITITPGMVRKTYVWTPTQTRVKTRQPLTLEVVEWGFKHGFAQAVEFKFREPSQVLDQKLRDSMSTEGTDSQ